MTIEENVHSVFIVAGSQLVFPNLQPGLQEVACRGKRALPLEAARAGLKPNTTVCHKTLVNLVNISTFL